MNPDSDRDSYPGSRTHRRLGAAARRLPPSRGNRPVHPTTLRRWIEDGVKGRDGQRIRLKGTRLPSGWVVSDEAVAEFLDALTRDRAGDSTPPAASQPQPEAAERAGQTLDQIWDMHTPHSKPACPRPDAGLPDVEQRPESARASRKPGTAPGRS
jgi:hypothetical protein